MREFSFGEESRIDGVQNERGKKENDEPCERLGDAVFGCGNAFAAPLINGDLNAADHNDQHGNDSDDARGPAVNDGHVGFKDAGAGLTDDDLNDRALGALWAAVFVRAVAGNFDEFVVFGWYGFNFPFAVGSALFFF